MIADLKPYTNYKKWGVPCLVLVARWDEISANILVIETEAEGLLGGLLGGHVS